jgi:hypothetical protein
MRQKIIFIDIDGPLAWGTWDMGYVTLNEDERNEFSIPYQWVKEDCDALKTILDESNAKLVLSSDWRFQFSFRQMKDIFQHYGIHPSHLLDMTCQFSLWNKMSRPSIDHERALQVVKWAKDNKISNWIAIDDLRLGNEFKWMRPRIPMWRHVAVDGDHGNGGRLRDKIDECINKLNR